VGLHLRETLCKRTAELCVLEWNVSVGATNSGITRSATPQAWGGFHCNPQGNSCSIMCENLDQRVVPQAASQPRECMSFIEALKHYHYFIADSVLDIGGETVYCLTDPAWMSLSE